MKKQFIWKGHEVKIVNTWVDDDNVSTSKGMLVEKRMAIPLADKSASFLA